MTGNTPAPVPGPRRTGPKPAGYRAGRHRSASRLPSPAPAPDSPQPGAPAARQLAAAGLALVALAAALAVTAQVAGAQSADLGCSAVALAVYCSGLLVLTAAATGGRALGLAEWKLGPWSLAWGVLAFGLATISWIGPQAGPQAEILPGSILTALGLIAVALTLLTAGYCIGPRRYAAQQASRVTGWLGRRYTQQVAGPAVPWLLLAAGLAGQAAEAVLTGQFGYVGDVAASVSTASDYQQFLSLIGLCVPLAVAVAAFRYHETKAHRDLAQMAVLFVAAIGLGAIAGGKQSFIVAILAVLIPSTAARRRVPWGGLTAAVLFFLLIVIPFNQAYREQARGAVTLSTGQAIATAPALAARVVTGDLSPTVLGQSADYLAQRLQAIDSPAIIVQRTPAQIPYASPVQLVTGPFVDAIPRVLWPGKPVLAVGYQFSQDYFDLPPTLFTASAITPEGDLYLHGGWVPLIAGMFLLGVGLRVLDDGASVRSDAHGALLILLLFPEIVQSGDGWSTMLGGLPGAIVLWLAVVAVSFTRRRAPAGAPGAAPSRAATAAGSR